MATIDKRLQDLEGALQPGGRVYVAWPIETQPGFYELDGGDPLTLEAIYERMTPADMLILVEFVNGADLAALDDTEHYD